VAAGRIGGVLGQDPGQDLGPEDVVAHRHQRPVGTAGDGRRVGRLLDERGDAVAIVDGDAAELVGLGPRHRVDPDGEVGVVGAVELVHLVDRELVDVVAAEHADVGRPGVAYQVEVLIDRVGGASVPELAEAHLRRHHLDVLAEPRQAPVARQVLDQARRHVLREQVDPAVAGVDEVRQDEVDDPELPGEGHRRLRTVQGERPEPRALPARHDHRQRVLHRCHGTPDAPPMTAGPGRATTPR
jgi:hypothetical protein